jgi:hypothetical protein
VNQTQTQSTRTFRGRSLDALLPQVKRELGDDAVILDRREVLDGGVGGFFQQRLVEVDAASAATARLFAAELERAEEDLAVGMAEVAPAPPPAPAHRPHVDTRVTDVSVDDLFNAPRQDPGLASLFSAGRDAEPAPAPEPARAPEPAPEPEPAAFAPPAVPAPEPAAAPEPRPFTPPPAQAEPAPPAGAAPPLALAAPCPDAGGDDLVAALAARGMDPAIADGVIAEAVERLAPLQPERPLRDLVVTALARRIPLARLAAGPRVVAVVGTGGAGKTTLAGRLQDGPAAAPITVLDTPAFSPRDGEGLRRLAAELRAAAAAEVHLVLPATTGVHAARELLRAVGDLGVTALAVSHADETEQLGTAVGLAIETGLPISFVGGAAPDARELAEGLLP